MAKELIRAPKSLSVWEANLKTIRQKQPSLAAALSEYVERHGHAFSHYETETPAGRWVGGFSPEPFFERHDAMQQGWERKSREAQIYFQYGIGTPPYLLNKAKALPKEAQSLVVVEPNIAMLAYTLHICSVYKAMPKGCALSLLTVPLPLNEEEATAEAQAQMKLRRELALREEALLLGVNPYGVYTVALSEISEHAGEREACKEAFAEVAHNIREWVRLRLTEMGNSAEDTLLGLRQMALMSPWISYGYRFTKLVERFKGRPFVVVSSGPSLDKNFRLLHEIKDKCVIVSTDGALCKLLDNDIVPHIVCALERGTPTYNLLFANSLARHAEKCADILLISQAVCTPKIYGRWPGPKIIIGKAEVPVDRWFVLETIGGQLVSSGSSVAHMCFSISVMMGASNLVLIGQDLAYAPDGTSHAGGVFDGQVLNAQSRQSNKGQVYTVPAALGGVVETSEVWLMFLRTLERMVIDCPVPVYDCTEGGALINGTVVQPLARFIEQTAASLDEMTTTPLGYMNEEDAIADKAERYGIVQPRLQESERQIEEIAEILDRIETLIQLVAAPDADIPKRRVYADEVGNLLKEIVARNAMFAFVTQSYIYQSTLEIAKVRFLENAEMVARWVDIHRDILDSHKTVLDFIRVWLGYASVALTYYRGEALPLTPPVDSMDALDAVVRDYGDGHDQTTLLMKMDYLFSAVDMRNDAWPGNLLWQCAMFLMKEGRSEEATPMMKSAADRFEDQQMATQEIAAFLKDYARVLAVPDLCFTPDFDQAEIVLKNAIAYGGVDEETERIRATIRLGREAKYARYGLLGGAKTLSVVHWFTARAAANEYLERGEPLVAMRMIWAAISGYGLFIPERAAAHLDWLVTNLEKFFAVDDEGVKAEIDRFLTEIADSPRVLMSLPILYSPAFAAALEEKGLDIALQIREESLEVQS